MPTTEATGMNQKDEASAPRPFNSTLPNNYCHRGLRFQANTSKMISSSTPAMQAMVLQPKWQSSLFLGARKGSEGISSPFVKKKTKKKHNT